MHITFAYIIVVVRRGDRFGYFGLEKRCRKAVTEPLVPACIEMLNVSGEEFGYFDL